MGSNKMGRPKVVERPYNLCILMDHSTIDKVDAFCAQFGFTRSKILRIVIDKAAEIMHDDPMSAIATFLDEQPAGVTNEQA